jgi:hypothetical protein
VTLERVENCGTDSDGYCLCEVMLGAVGLLYVTFVAENFLGFHSIIIYYSGVLEFKGSR